MITHNTMPTNQAYSYRRNRSYRRRRRPQHRNVSFNRNTFTKYAGYAYGAYKIASKLKKLVNVEVKHFDSTHQNTPNQAGNVDILNDIPQGDTDVTRDGDSLKVQNVVANVQIVAAADADVRLIMIWDKENQVATVADYLETTGGALSYLNEKDWDNRFKTRTLFDKTYQLVNGTENDRFNVKIKMPIGLHTQFDNGTTAIQTGALKFLSISNVTSGMPSVNIVSRIEFTDN